MPKSVILLLPLLAVCTSAGDARAQTPPPAPASTRGAATVPMSPPMYLVIYKAGPNWKHDVPSSEQLREHGRYMFGLHLKKALKMGGPFTDVTGGSAVLEAESLAAAQALVDADPAVSGKIFVAEVHAWRHVDWDELARLIQARSPQP